MRRRRSITLKADRPNVRGHPRTGGDSPKTPLAVHLDVMERLLDELQRGHHVPMVGGESPLWGGDDECRAAGRTPELQDTIRALRAEVEECRRAAQELSANLADFQDFYDEAPVGYHSLDSEGLFIRVNDTELSWLGYSREELLGRPIEEVMTPRSRERYRQAFPELKQRGWVRDLEVEIVRKDGSVIPVLVNATAVKDAAGRYLRSRSTFCDISERKRTEALLQASAKQWETTFDAIGEGVCLLDAAQRIVRCNRAMALIQEAPRELLIGRNCCEVFRQGETPGQECLISQVRQSRRRETAMLRLRERLFAVVADPVLLASEVDGADEFAGVVYIMSDVTASFEAERARQAAEHELATQRVLSMAADRLRTLGEMAAAIAHELNQPLSGARGLAEHLLIGMERGWDIPPAKLRERLALIVDQADRMSHIIERVRMFAREAGKLEVHPVQLNDVVRAATGMVGEHFRARGITLECELADALPPVPANTFSLEEVVLNLLTNARDAVVEKTEAEKLPSPSERGAGGEGVSRPPARILVRTLARSRETADYGVIQVIDDGIGIRPEILPKVFEPFFTTKPPNRGTGIGLAVSKYIVEQFRGTIEIESQPGRGTTVTIVLPVRGCEVT